MTYLTHIDEKAEAYKALGLNYNCGSVSDIKRAYRRLAMKWHPDKNENSVEAAQQFKKINEAYQFLTTDPKETVSVSNNDPYSYAIKLTHDALEIIQTKVASKEIAFWFMERNPKLLKNLGIYLSQGFVTLEEFREDTITSRHWHVISNSDYWFLELKMKRAGSVQKYLDNFDNDKQIQAAVHNDELNDLGWYPFYFLWLRMLPVSDVFDTDNLHSEELEKLKWAMLIEFLSKSHIFDESWCIYSKLEEINEVFGYLLYTVYKNVIVPIKKEIEFLNEMPSPQNILKAKQLESVIVEMESELLKRIPEIVDGKKKCRSAINVLKPYAKSEQIAGYPNLIAYYLKALIGTLLSIVTCGLALLSDNFIHTFFHNDARYPLYDASKLMRDREANVITAPYPY
jgi:hypothetical protein